MKKFYRVFSSIFLALLLVVAFAVPCSAAANAPAGFVESEFPLELCAGVLFLDGDTVDCFDLTSLSVGYAVGYFPAGKYYIDLSWDPSAVFGATEQSFYPVTLSVGTGAVNEYVYPEYDGSLCFVIPEDACVVYLDEESGYPEGYYAEVFLNCCWPSNELGTLWLYSPSAAEASGNVVSNILSVWSSIIRWFTGAFDRLVPLFYSAETGLTFVGFLAVGGLAVAAAFLLLNLVRKWLNFGT